ncbi:protocadherin alpha-9-like, partial [Sapajus apella]|uniref:Protocadherin alpha-9-like n=1 Tax=Sapajus apella TaxID=9515 RepID=A0A6J3HH11_SAPAP
MSLFAAMFSLNPDKYSPFPRERDSILFHSLCAEQWRTQQNGTDEISRFFLIWRQFSPIRKDRVFEMLYSSRGDPEAPHLLLSLTILAIWKVGSGQVHYSVLEEAKHGTFVGRIAQDLGLELEELVPRLFQLDSKGRGDLLEVNLQNGILFVNSRIDREELCGRSAECSIHLEVIVDRPLQVFHVDVEVRDINDNPPLFPATQKNLIIAESRPIDSRFPLEGASDADIGENALLSYRLSPNEYFSLDVPTSNQQV